MLSEVVDGNDIGVAEGGCRTRFLLEAVQQVPVCGECGGENLNRYTAVQARILRPVHFSHSARAQGRDDFIGAQFGARSEGHSVRVIIVPRKGL